MKNIIENRMINFPYKISIFTIAIFSLLYIVGPVPIKAVSGTVNMYFIMFEFFRILFRLLAICLLGSLILILHKFLKRIIKSKTTWAVLSLLPVILMSIYSLYYSWPSVRAERILTNAGLASLPKSATELKVFTWSTGFSGYKFLKFRANPDDIEQFLKTSSILEEAECREYSKDRMRLYPNTNQQSRKSDQDSHEYISHDPHTPPWYMQEIKEPARRYRFRPKGYNDMGEVIIVVEKKLIFVKLVIG